MCLELFFPMMPNLFCTLNKKRNIQYFVDRTRLLSISIFKLKTKLVLTYIFSHRLRDKFLQPIQISLDSASRTLHQYSRRMCGKMNSSKVDNRSGNRTRDLMVVRLTLYITTRVTLNMNM